MKGTGFFTPEELSKHVTQERKDARARCEKAGRVQSGNVWVDLSDKTVNLDVYTEGAPTYWFKVSDVESMRGLVQTMDHLSHKVWCDAALMGNFVMALKEYWYLFHGNEEFGCSIAAITHCYDKQEETGNGHERRGAGND